MINSKRNRSKLDRLHFNAGENAFGSSGGSGMIAKKKQTKTAMLCDIVIMTSCKLNSV